MNLSEIIKERIRREGPISFHDFMEMSLYHPGCGYYTSEGDKIGKEGDFYTSPVLTGLFGEMLANQLEEMWYVLGSRRFTIVECGAGTGLLCRDILHALEGRKDLYRHLDYYIVERSLQMREKEEKILPGKVRWFDSIGDIPAVTG
jgi:SAM-dependent MidA family methyltransferase